MTLFCVLSCSVDMPPSNEPTVHVEQNPELGTKLSGVLGGLAEWGVQGSRSGAPLRSHMEIVLHWILGK